MAEKKTEAASDSKVVVVMRPHLWGHKAGQKRYVTQEEADFLLRNNHADLPASKR